MVLLRVPAACENNATTRIIWPAMGLKFHGQAAKNFQSSARLAANGCSDAVRCVLKTLNAPCRARAKTQTTKASTPSLGWSRRLPKRGLRRVKRLSLASLRQAVQFMLGIGGPPNGHRHEGLIGCLVRKRAKLTREEDWLKSS